VILFPRLPVQIVVLGALLVAPLQAAPDVQEILRKFIEHADNDQLAERRNAISYQRTSRVEYLKDDGSVKKNVLRVYKVFPENGQSVTKLVSVNGRPAKEKEEKQRSAARETGEKSRGLDISDDLLSRFEFSFLREEKFVGRPAWVLAFKPKAGAPNDEFFDKFINAMAGSLWIDQEDYQLAKADVHLSKRIAFFGGLAGAIDKLDLTLIQRRLEPALWLGEAIQIDFTGRKLFTSMRFRAFENCSDFKATSAEQAKADLPVKP
jgi:hypothetical protein